MVNFAYHEIDYTLQESGKRNKRIFIWWTACSHFFLSTSKQFTLTIFLKKCGRQEFLDPGESVVLISKLKKINKLANKKVQLILTDKPQLIYVDPSKMVAKGNIIWSDDPSELSVQVTNSSHFRICTVFI